MKKKNIIDKDILIKAMTEANKDQLAMLIRWAENEIKEYQDFIKMVKAKKKNLTK